MKLIKSYKKILEDGDKLIQIYSARWDNGDFMSLLVDGDGYISGKRRISRDHITYANEFFDAFVGSCAGIPVAAITNNRIVLMNAEVAYVVASDGHFWFTMPVDPYSFFDTLFGDRDITIESHSDLYMMAIIFILVITYVWVLAALYLQEPGKKILNAMETTGNNVMV